VKRVIFTALFALTIVVIRTAFAADPLAPGSLPLPPATQPSGQAFKRNFPVVDVNFGGSYSPRADLDSGGGFSRTSWSSNIGLLFPVVPRTLLGRVGFGYSNVFYDFRGHPQIHGSDRPWNQIDIANTSAGLYGRINDQWGAFVGFNVKSAEQTGTDFGRSLTYGGLAGATYRFSDHLSVGLAIIAQSRLEDNPVVLPFPAFDWVLPFDHDRWRLFSGGARGGLEAGNNGGVKVGLSYTPVQYLTLSAGLSGIGLANDFRLNSRSAVSNGVVQDHSTQVAFAIDYHPFREASISGFVGADLPNKLNVLSSSGNSVYSEDFSATLVAGLALKFRF
jgi:hypothetical protein